MTIRTLLCVTLFAGLVVSAPLSIKESFGEPLIKCLDHSPHLIREDNRQMNAKDELSKISAFVLEANKLAQELHAASGAEPDEFELEEERTLEIEIMKMIREKDLKSLRYMQAEYISGFDAVVDPKFLEMANQRLYQASGIDVGGVEANIIKKGEEILSKNKVHSIEEFQDLDRFLNLLKDKADNRQWEVEELLGRYSKKYDK